MPETLRVQTSDRHGRNVAVVSGKVNLGQFMVEDGLAFAYQRYLRHSNRKADLDAEVRARPHGRSIGRESGGITRPWDFQPVHHAGTVHHGSTPDGSRYCSADIGSCSCAEPLLRQGHSQLGAAAKSQA